MNREPLDRNRSTLFAVASWGIGVGLLAVVYGPRLLRSMRRATHPLIANDDARQQIFPFFRYADPALFPKDYLGDYYLEALLPGGYKLFYRTAALAWDPAVVASVLPYVLLAVLLVFVAATAYRLGGTIASLFAMALCLTGSPYLLSVGGGLPRAFAFPVLAGGLAALAFGRARLAMVMVWVGAAFYPVAGFLLGVTTTIVWLALPAGDRGSGRSWSLARRLTMLAITGLVSAALLSPTAIASGAYGRILSGADVQQYPETGIGGRYQAKNVPPWPGYFTHAAKVAERSIRGHGRPWLRSGRRLPPAFWYALLVVSAVGWIGLLPENPGARVVTAFAVAAIAGYFVATRVAPFLYLPPRYVMYPVPLLCVLVIPASFVRLGRWAGAAVGQRLAGPMVAAVSGIVLLVVMGGEGNPELGLRVDARSSAGLLEAVGRLPKDAMVAGFPRGAVDDIPLFARRQVLMSSETHQVFHEGYVLEMRRRLRAFLAAYFATGPEPIRRLRDEFGVTHLLVDRAHLKGRAPGYFEPFKPWVSKARRDAGGPALLLSRPATEAEVYRKGRLRLVDLAVLLGPAGLAPEAAARSTRDSSNPEARTAGPALE